MTRSKMAGGKSDGYDTSRVDAALEDLMKHDADAAAGWPSGYDKEKVAAATANDFRVLDVAMAMAPEWQRHVLARSWAQRLRTASETGSHGMPHPEELE